MGTSTDYRAELLPELLKIHNDASTILERYNWFLEPDLLLALQTLSVVDFSRMGAGPKTRGKRCHHVLHVVSRDIDHYQRFIDVLLMEELGIERYFTYIITKVVKNLPDSVPAWALNLSDNTPRKQKKQYFPRPISKNSRGAFH